MLATQTAERKSPACSVGMVSSVVVVSVAVPVSYALVASGVGIVVSCETLLKSVKW